MKTIDLTKYIKEKSTYIVGCSFGPDSMALLSMVKKLPIKVVVCFINYHKRKESVQEEKDITKYCEENDLTLEVFSCKGMKIQGNFQAWARDIRYRFFLDMYNLYRARGLFLGHQQDDLIETYYIQKQRKSTKLHFGLKLESIYQSMKVLRPLLGYSKQQLLEYCIDNNIPYSIDQSNVQAIYLRNKIRLDVINNMSVEEKHDVIQEIKRVNKHIDYLEKMSSCIIKKNKYLAVSDIYDLTKEELEFVLIKYINRSQMHYSLSEGKLREINKMINSLRPNIEVCLAKNIFLVKEYDELVIVDKTSLKEYTYIMEKPGVYTTSLLDIDLTSDHEDRNIKLSDFPITIRSPLYGDKSIIESYSVSLSRLFIDWKMPTRLRKVWPVVLNKDGKIIYVPRYKKNFIETHKSKFNIYF